MAIGDGVTWAESKPDNDTVAHQIDEYNRDLRVGVRSRAAREHVWPASQTNTNEGGHHIFVTFQAQTAAPTMAGTTAGGLWVGTDKALYFTDSAGTDFMLIESGAGIPLITSGTLGSIAICSSAAPSALTVLAASAPDLYLKTNTNTAAPSWGNPITDHFGLGIGVVNHGTTIGSISGFASSQCSVFVSLNGGTSAVGTSNPDGIGYVISVDANRLVNATWRAIGAGGSGTCSVNYLIIGTK